MASNFTIATTFTAVDRMTQTMGKIEKQGLGLGKTLGALGGIALVGKAMTDAANFEERMTRLGISMDMPADKTAAMAAQIQALGSAAGINVNTSELTGAVEQIAERTGDLKFANENLKSMAVAIQATGASGEAIGGMFAEFEKMGLGATDAMKAIDTLTIQGKKGAFTLKDLAALGPRVVSAYSATGRTGVGALTEMGAALQVIRQGTGSSEQAATAFEAMMRTFTDADKQKKLAKMGVSVRDSAGNFRSVVDIMGDVVNKSGGSLEKIGDVFDAEAVRAFNSSIAEFKRTGATSAMGEFLQATGNGSTVLSDAARAAATANQKTAALWNQFNAFASQTFADLSPSLMTLMDKLSPAIGILAGSVNQIVKFVAGDSSSDKMKRQSVGVLDMIPGIGNPGQAIGKLWDRENLVNGIKNAGSYGMGLDLNDWQIERMAGMVNQKGRIDLGWGANYAASDIMAKMSPEQQDKLRAVQNNTYEMKTREDGKQEIVITFANPPAGMGLKQSGSNNNVTTNLGPAKVTK